MNWGFPGEIDRAIATVGVAGLDRTQSLAQLRLTPNTEPRLYAPPPPIHYRPGSRPILAAIDLPGGPDRAMAALHWVHRTITHAHHVPTPTRPDRALTEEELIASGVGWCNEQARVFIALCALADLPGRLCFCYHENLRCGHTTAEIFLRGQWVFFDPTFAVVVELPEGRLAEARELSGRYRSRAHDAYRAPLTDYYRRCQPHVELAPGWRTADRPDPDRGGDLLAHLGFTDYPIEGAA